MPAPPPLSAAAAIPDHPAAGEEAVHYPSSDGKPLAENMWQGEAIMNAASDLKTARPQALVAADTLVYPQRGNNRVSIAPDVLVAFGLTTEKRSSYFVWVEGKPPDWVLEVASPSTEANDRGEKLQSYAAMGVPECWLFDPKGDVFPHGTPRLQGHRLKAGEYVALPSRLVAGERVIRSCALGLDVCVDGELLRFKDPKTGRDIRHRAEVEAAVDGAEAQARQEAAQRSAADAWAERETTRAEQQAARAEQEAARADSEAAARMAAEARIAELEAALRRSRAGG